jgi:hypothetical protein
LRLLVDPAGTVLVHGSTFVRLSPAGAAAALRKDGTAATAAATIHACRLGASTEVETALCKQKHGEAAGKEDPGFGKD